jgi:hypothetical protein
MDQKPWYIRKHEQGLLKRKTGNLNEDLVNDTHHREEDAKSDAEYLKQREKILETEEKRIAQLKEKELEKKVAELVEKPGTFTPKTNKEYQEARKKQKEQTDYVIDNMIVGADAKRGRYSAAGMFPGKMLEHPVMNEHAEKISQKEKAARGLAFENTWRVSMQVYKCFGTKNITGYDGTPFDYWFVSKKGAYAMELKVTITDRLGYSSFTDNEKVGLEAFEEETEGFGTSYVIICHMTPVIETVHVVPWSKIREGVLSGRAGSIRLEEFPKLDPLFLKKEETGLKRDLDIWDISMFAGDVKEAYKDAYDKAKDRLVDIRRGGYGLTKEERAILEEQINIAKSRVHPEKEIKSSDMGDSSKNLFVGNKNAIGRTMPIKRRTGRDNPRNRGIRNQQIKDRNNRPESGASDDNF